MLQNFKSIYFIFTTFLSLCGKTYGKETKLMIKGNYIVYFLIILIFLVSSVLSIIYFVSAGRMSYKPQRLKSSLGYIRTKKKCPEVAEMAIAAVVKTNGFNKMCVIYTVLYYLFNIYSILFSVISIACNCIFESTKPSMLTSCIALLTVSFNLFLKCADKWDTFRKPFKKSRKATREFIAKWDDVEDEKLCDFVKSYVNRIDQIEKNMKTKDLT